MQKFEDKVSIRKDQIKKAATLIPQIWGQL
jgi:hypothetical protein